jgi:hypothetical protein
MPLRRDANVWCVDLETGDMHWKISSFGQGGGMLIADGYLVAFDSFDNTIYCFGKGPSATTVTIQDNVIAKGETVLITGTVTDQTPSGRQSTTGNLEFALKDTPAIADEDQEEWMEYMFQQRPMPTDAKGVEVTLDAIDSNGNMVSIGRATSDMSGMFKKSWTPDDEGEYIIIATFEGSDSYFSSYGETALAVGPAPAPSGQIEPEPYAFPMTEIALVAAVAIAVVLGIVAFWAIRKR